LFYAFLNFKKTSTDQAAAAARKELMLIPRVAIAAEERPFLVMRLLAAESHEQGDSQANARRKRKANNPASLFQTFRLLLHDGLLF
jgi:hypothetical protein